MSGSETVLNQFETNYLNIFSVLRLAQWLSKRHLGWLARLLLLAANTIFSSSVPLSLSVGRFSVCEHRGLGVVIHPQAVVGDHVHIFPHVVLGGKGRGIPGAPVIGDNVTLGAGAKILGPIRIGNNAVVGANAVVLTDVPAGAVAVGNPARIVGSGSER